MFKFFKKGNKEPESTSIDDLPWGVPVKRKLTKKEEAAELEEELMIERRSKERRDMYRPLGKERIFKDPQGRRLVLRVEDSMGVQTGSSPVFLVVFWGTHELAHLKADLQNQALKLLDYHTESDYVGWGLSAELLGEVERLAQAKGAKELCATLLTPQADWETTLFTQLGYQLRGSELVKLL